MFKPNKLLLFFFLAFPAFVFAEESITITTYYPSPYGSYNELTTTGNTYLATNSGRVGIGTTNPGYKLDVIYDGGASTTLADFFNSNNVWQAESLIEMSTDQGAGATRPSIKFGYHRGFSADSQSGFIVKTGNRGSETEKFRITYGGNVGIGVTNPDYSLVVSNKNSSSGIRISNPANNDGTSFTWSGTDAVWTNAGSSGNVIKLDAGSNIQFWTGVSWVSGNAERMRITNSGNVGIGTASPQAKLHLYDSTNQTFTSLLRLRAVTGGEGSREYELGLANDIQANHLVLRKTSDANPGMFSIRMSGQSNYDFLINNSGNVGIGTTSPAGKLDVNGTIYQRGSLLHADYVFEPGYELEGIEEHAEYMWREKHLKSVPRAQKDESGQEMLEIGAHRRGILEELEKAHVYIQQLNERMKVLEMKLSKLEGR